MKCHEENTPTTTTKEVTTKTTTGIKMAIMVKRIGTKNNKSSYQKKDDKKGIQGQGCLPYINQGCKIPLSCRI